MLEAPLVLANDCTAAAGNKAAVAAGAVSGGDVAGAEDGCDANEEDDGMSSGGMFGCAAATVSAASLFITAGAEGEEGTGACAEPDVASGAATISAAGTTSAVRDLTSLPFELPFTACLEPFSTVCGSDRAEIGRSNASTLDARGGDIESELDCSTRSAPSAVELSASSASSSAELPLPAAAAPLDSDGESVELGDSVATADAGSTLLDTPSKKSSSSPAI